MYQFNEALLIFFFFNVVFLVSLFSHQGKPEQRAVPELVLSLIALPEQQNGPIADLSLPWSALVLLPHLR